MAMALGHFAFGAALTALCVTYLVPSAPYPRVGALLGGGWAMLRDVHWIAPVGATRLQRFHGSAVADLFWFHRTLDALDPDDSKVVAAGMLALLIGATAVAERREYRTLAAIRERAGVDAAEG